jgi:hypothetical protein
MGLPKVSGLALPVQHDVDAELESYRKLAFETKNPVYIWRALAVWLTRGKEMPPFLHSYLLHVSGDIVDLAYSDPPPSNQEVAAKVLDAMGFSAKGRSVFGEHAKDMAALMAAEVAAYPSLFGNEPKRLKDLADSDWHGGQFESIQRTADPRSAFAKLLRRGRRLLPHTANGTVIKT